MRILVLEENGESAIVRERREVFALTEFRLSYTCPKCRTEFSFDAESGEPQKKWTDCPVCGEALKVRNTDNLNPEPYLWEAVSLYREFHKFVTKAELPLTLVAITPEHRQHGALQTR